MPNLRICDTRKKNPGENTAMHEWMCLFCKCLWCIVVFDKFVCIFCDCFLITHFFVGIAHDIPEGCRCRGAILLLNGYSALVSGIHVLKVYLHIRVCYSEEQTEFINKALIKTIWLVTARAGLLRIHCVVSVRQRDRLSSSLHRA